jgi:hypothetical protein
MRQFNGPSFRVGLDKVLIVFSHLLHLNKSGARNLLASFT